MLSPRIEYAFKKYPELGLALKSQTSCIYQVRTRTGIDKGIDLSNTVIVQNREAELYVRTYEYCKALIRRDRYNAAKDICLSRNELSPLPFDRLPFLALLTDPGHLIEAVELQPKLEIVPKVKGRRVKFFYEEGQKHQQVQAGFVGHHLRTNCLCEDDVKRKRYDKAILRAVTTPLSSQLISTYDAHIQCNMLLQGFDLRFAIEINRDFSLQRDVKQEYIEFIMPLALEFRDIYRSHSLDAARHFAHHKGFEPVIRNGKLVTLKKHEKIETARFPSGSAQKVADVPTLDYIIPQPEEGFFTH